MNKKSFTLIELLVVIAIIGILSSLVIARFSDWGDNARIANTLQWSAGVHRTLGANLVGHWPLNGDTKDISGYGNNGTMHGFTGDPNDYWVDGVSGNGDKALKFAGGSYVRIGNLPIFDINDEITISAWFLVKNWTQGGSLVSRYIYEDGNNRWDLQVNRTDDRRVRFLHHGANARTVLSGELSLEKWYQVVYTGNTSTNESKLYLDGILVNSNSLDRGWLVNTDLVIGRGEVQLIFDGFIEEVCIYRSALTAEEVSRIYTETKDQYLAYE